MNSSIRGFKKPRADLHRWSPFVFASAVVIALAVTALILNLPIVKKQKAKSIQTPAPVYMTITTIPPTKYRVTTAAPAVPYSLRGEPVPVDIDETPDDITIEETEISQSSEPPGDNESPAASGTGGPSAVSEQPQGDIRDIYDLATVEEKPERIGVVLPDYPEMAKRAGIEGVVYVKVLVNATGSVDSVEVVKGPSIFHNSALEAAAETTFKPARYNNEPVACWAIMPFRFTLQR